ncbi:MAG: hypothetical protein U0Q16_19770 [Bryobacteraceae bacterium]
MGKQQLGQTQHLLELDGRIACRIHDFDSVGLTGGSRAAGRPMNFSIGAGTSSDVFRWIAKSTAEGARKSGAIIAMNSSLQSVLRLRFLNALIASIGIPELSPAIGNGYLRLGILPEQFTEVIGQEKVNPGVHGGSFGPLRTGSFRLAIEGLEKDCAHVKRILPFAIRTKTKGLYVGSSTAPAFEPTGSEVPNLVLELPAAQAVEMWAWHEATLAGSPQTATKNGTLQLAPGSGHSSPKIDLRGLSIVSVSKGSGVARVELACESMMVSAG